MTNNYEKNKKHILKWREEHKEEFNNYMKQKTLERYYRCRDKINERRCELKKLRRNTYYCETEIFRKILL